MTSFEELVRLNKDGDLGKMLAKRFQGERGYTQDPEDMDLLIAFESIEKTPTIEEIIQAVIEHYKQLGYKIENCKMVGNMFDAIVYSESKGSGIMIIVITTQYPLTIGEKTTNHLRLTTTAC